MSYRKRARRQQQTPRQAAEKAAAVRRTEELNLKIVEQMVKAMNSQRIVISGADAHSPSRKEDLKKIRAYGGGDPLHSTKGHVTLSVRILKTPQPIELPPGIGLKEWSHRWLSKKAVKQVFDPLIADYQYEHMQAVARGATDVEIAALHREYRQRFGIAILREIGPAIWRVIVAIGVALKIAG